MVTILFWRCYKTYRYILLATSLSFWIIPLSGVDGTRRRRATTSCLTSCPALSCASNKRGAKPNQAKRSSFLSPVSPTAFRARSRSARSLHFILLLIYPSPAADPLVWTLDNSWPDQVSWIDCVLHRFRISCYIAVSRSFSV